jgi:hypothetical protein
LGIIVAVIIDKAGRDDEAISINGAGRRVAEFADRHNLPVGDCDIAAEGGHAGAINDATVLN